MTSSEFLNIASDIPALPGVYKYFDTDGKLIYVGKAKHLKKRVGSYFIKNNHNQKTIELVKKINRIEFTIVDSEEDAFLLENNLIKEYQPIYNINLKDDKSYPYVVIKNEPFPRVFITRKKIPDGSLYFGPYTSIENVRELLEFIKQTFPLRTCTLALSEKNIAKKKFKVCLEYHLGNCKGPCEGLQTDQDYSLGIAQLISLLKGNITPVIQHIKKEIEKATKELAFEKAAVLQEKINGLIRFQAKSTVVNTKTGTIDVFSIVEEGDFAFINYLHVFDGNIVHTKTISLQKKLEETASEMLPLAIMQLRNLFNSDAKEIITTTPIEYPQEGIKIIIPKAGDKRKLLDLSIKNALYFKKLHITKTAWFLNQHSENTMKEILAQLQADLHLKELPTHIECFDNSNISGAHPVSAMVCFKNGVPSKKDYRHYNIKTVQGINDFASMKEVVYRRYKQVAEQKGLLPQLIIIDGGKGQLSAAMESIRALQLIGKTTLVGLAKNKEEIFFTGDSASLILPWGSKSLMLIRQIRDEVHRFGINFHRKKRSQAAITNELRSIDGIGLQTADVLLSTFKSVKKIKKLSESEIAAIVGKSKARIIVTALQEKST